MNKIVRISAIALAIVAHVSCFGMMTVFNDSNSPQRLTNDCLVGVAHQAPMQTKLNVRATCHEMEKRIKIEELENARAALRGERTFYIDTDRLIQDRYLNTSFTRERADELGWDYNVTAFSADGFLVIDAQYGEVDRELYRSAYSHVHKNEDLLFRQDYKDLKDTFSLARKLGDRNAQGDIMFEHIPNNRYGLKHVFGMGIVRSAIFNKDWEFARDLVKTNPHGFCGGRDNKKQPELVDSHIRSSYSDHVGIAPFDKNLLALVELAKSQPYYYEKKHEHCTIL